MPGLLTFDFDSHTFPNSSDGGYAGSRLSLNSTKMPAGSMHFIESFGIYGILVIMGGGDGSDAGGAFNNITIFDIERKIWTFQAATGSIPKPRAHFCAVSVKGETDSSYEM